MEKWMQRAKEIESTRAAAEKQPKRKRQAKWDHRNMRTVSTHLTRKEAEKLQNICETIGESQYSLLRRFLLDIISQVDGDDGTAWRDPPFQKGNSLPWQ